MKKMITQNQSIQFSRNFSWLKKAPPLVLLFGWLTLVYIVNNFWNPQNLKPEILIYFLRPLAWLSLGALVYWLYKQGRITGIMPKDKWLITVAALIGLAQIGITFIFGLIFDLGYSPYARTWYLILGNIWYLGTQILCLELTRWAFLKLFGKVNTNFSIIITWLICSFIMITPGRYQLLSDFPGIFEFIGNTLLAVFATNLLATYLTLAGGPIVSVAYMAVTAGFEWLSPVLPDLPLMINAFLNTILPTIGLIILHKYFLESTQEEIAQVTLTDSDDQEGKAGSMFGSWIFILMFAIGLIFFNTGIFGIKPMLISGFSMKPTFVAGDLVITKTVSDEDLVIGDVIWFTQDGIDILHRIIEIKESNNTTVYVTQGDNNNITDAPILYEQIMGEVVVVIPKIGWVAIWIRQAVTWIGSILR